MDVVAQFTEKKLRTTIVDGGRGVACGNFSKTKD